MTAQTNAQPNLSRRLIQVGIETLLIVVLSTLVSTLMVVWDFNEWDVLEGGLKLLQLPISAIIILFTNFGWYQIIVLLYAVLMFLLAPFRINVWAFVGIGTGVALVLGFGEQMLSNLQLGADFLLLMHPQVLWSMVKYGLHFPLAALIIGFVMYVPFRALLRATGE